MLDSKIEEQTGFEAGFNWGGSEGTLDGQSPTVDVEGSKGITIPVKTICKQEDAPSMETNILEKDISILRHMAQDARTALSIYQDYLHSEGKVGDELLEHAVGIVETLNADNRTIASGDRSWPVILPIMDSLKLIANTEIPASGNWRDAVSQQDCWNQLMLSVETPNDLPRKRDSNLRLLESQYKEDSATLKGGSAKSLRKERYKAERKEVLNHWAELSQRTTAAATDWASSLNPAYPSKVMHGDETYMTEVEIQNLLEVKLKHESGMLSDHKTLSTRWTASVVDVDEAFIALADLWEKYNSAALVQLNQWHQDKLTPWFIEYQEFLKTPESATCDPVGSTYKRDPDTKPRSTGISIK